MKGLIIFSHQMEDVEALATKALLIRAGIEMVAATFEETNDIKTAYGQIVKADAFMREIDISDFDFLVIPGGPYVSSVIETDVNLKKLAIDFNHQEKMIAAICAGPRFLGRAGLLYGKKFTCYTGCEVDMPNGEYVSSLKAITDGQIITARGAGAVYDFVYEMVKFLFDTKTAEKLLKNILF